MKMLQVWMFVNSIDLQWYYIIYGLLKKQKQVKRYSITDFIKHLYELKKVKINDQWIPEPHKIYRVTLKKSKSTYYVI